MTGPARKAARPRAEVKRARKVARKTPATVRWFGVKTIYRTTTRDRPRSVDAYYDAKATLVEERVVVFRAATFRQAIALAEREARAYARGTWTNLYGQRMAQEYLGECNAFEMYEPPAAGFEVYSRTQLVSRETSDRKLGDVLLGVEESPRARAKRRKFSNRDLSPKGDTLIPK